MTTRFRTAASSALLLLLAGASVPLEAQQPSATPSVPASAGRRGVTAEDYYAFTFAADPRLSPNGSMVVYVASRVDRARNRRLPSLWVVPADGGAPPRRIVDESWSPSAPRWSPDGRTIAFTSRGAAPDSAGTTAAPNAPPPAPAGAALSNARAQLWTVAATGGTPRRVTSAANGVSNCAWSPDGARFACLVKTGPSDSLNKGPERSDVRHYAHSGYKYNDTGWFDDKRTHVWIFDAASGAARQITSGDDWNDTEPQWSPDGGRVAFVSDRTGKEFDEGWTSDVWTVPAAGGNPTRVSTITAHNASPAWSPDGRTIAFLSSPSDNDPPTIMLAPSDGRGAPRVASKSLDLIPSALQWGPGGRALYFETGVRGESQLYRVDVPSGAVHPVTAGPRGVRAPNVNAATGRVVYLANDFKHLDDVYSNDTDGRHERKLTDLNAELWKDLDLASVERMTYKGADGWKVDGFLVRPLGWTAGKKYPMILSVHGGPAGQYGVDWYHEFQVYAAKGYAVFFTNPRGSTGYGRAFQRGIVNQWGGNDYVDVMNGVRAVVAQNPWIDTTRLGVTGGSYGGYMTNWIVGHTPMFKAAVTLRSVVNFVSDEGTRDGAYGHKEDFGGDLFEKFDLYWDRSPLKYAKNVTTPILILHSDADYRVPLEQGEQWFRALRHFGKTAEIVMFPRENHNLTRTGEPRHLVESMNWQLYWFDRYLNGNGQAVPPDRRP
ncbi:MAG TPA: S9 family peptidase [Gemmatimonadaceae bacterium]|nr:S9 family peptidase [Gemmatimonadaceae bacterium]